MVFWTPFEKSRCLKAAALLLYGKFYFVNALKNNALQE